jgi:hypothetical protein
MEKRFNDTFQGAMAEPGSQKYTAMAVGATVDVLRHF